MKTKGYIQRHKKTGKYFDGHATRAFRTRYTADLCKAHVFSSKSDAQDCLEENEELVEVEIETTIRIAKEKKK